MKCNPAIPAVIVVALSACDTMNQPISGGEFDPLRPPGSYTVDPRQGMGETFTAGQFVRCTMDNTAFFNARPRGDMDADRLLRKGTSMKVISTSDSYTKVELDSGQVGWVPTILLEDPKAAQTEYPVNPGEYQVYPPPQGLYGDPFPVVDPADQPPGGSIPTVIDPDAPSTVVPPPVVPPGGVVEPPTIPGTGLAPLPPNGEEDETPAEAPPAVAPPAGTPPAEAPPAEVSPRLEE